MKIKEQNSDFKYLKVKLRENIIENTRTYKQCEDEPGSREASRKRYSCFSASTHTYFVRNVFQ